MFRLVDTLSLTIFLTWDGHALTFTQKTRIKQLSTKKLRLTEHLFRGKLKG